MTQKQKIVLGAEVIAAIFVCTVLAGPHLIFLATTVLFAFGLHFIMKHDAPASIGQRIGIGVGFVLAVLACLTLRFVFPCFVMSFIGKIIVDAPLYAFSKR